MEEEHNINTKIMSQEGLCTVLHEISELMKEDNKPVSAQIIDEAIRRLSVKEKPYFNDEQFNI